MSRRKQAVASVRSRTRAWEASTSEYAWTLARFRQLFPLSNATSVSERVNARGVSVPDLPQRLACLHRWRQRHWWRARARLHEAQGAFSRGLCRPRRFRHAPSHTSRPLKGEFTVRACYCEAQRLQIDIFDDAQVEKISSGGGLRVLISHVPVIRTIRPQDNAIGELRPDLILTAHDHTGEYYVKRRYERATNARRMYQMRLSNALKVKHWRD